MDCERVLLAELGKSDVPMTSRELGRRTGLTPDKITTTLRWCVDYRKAKSRSVIDEYGRRHNEYLAIGKPWPPKQESRR